MSGPYLRLPTDSDLAVSRPTVYRVIERHRNAADV
jgi:hypothetical protein